LLERIVVWEPATRLGYTIAGLPPAAGTVTTVWELAPADGGTLATIRTTIEGVPGPPGKIVGRVLGRRMARAATDMLNGIARYVDTTQEHS
jgi:thioredoxin reductase